MKKLKENKKLYIILFTVVFLVTCFIFYNIMFDFTSIVDRNIKNTSAANSILYLSDVTPFKWEQAFIVAPYIGGDALDKIVGVKCNLKPIDVDWIRRIVFIKDKKFVYDYLYNINDLSFNPLGIIIDKNHCKFIIKKSNSSSLLLKYSE